MAVTAADVFETLNPQQRAAVLHGDAPLLVIAGAGSGKTLTLAARVARLVLDGADPQRLLLLTFSRRAAAHMQQRTGRLLHQALGLRGTQAAPALPWAGTFHAIGARLLRLHAAQLGLSEQFTVVDRADAEDLMGLVRQDLGFAAAKSRFPLKATCLSIYSRCVNAQQPLAAVLAEHFPWCAAWEAELKQLFRAYVAEKQRQHTLDYDDLLLAWHHAQAPAPGADASLARQLGERFDHVLVDEYQDTNRLQSAILRGLKPDGRGLTVVGDDAQSIYSFRAAEVRNILEFEAQFGATARVLPLERNYRSTQPLLAASNAVIELAAERHAKTLWSEQASAQKPLLVTVDDDQAQVAWVCQHVLALRENGLKLKQQAVLFRTGHHSTLLELELTRRRIPFVKYGGLKFLEATHIKDVLAVLRWADNPKSRLAGFRVAQLVPGIGPAHARRLLDAMDAAPDALQALRNFVPPAGTELEWQPLVALVQALQQRDSWPADVEAAQRWYAPHLLRLHEDTAPVRQADLDQLARIAAGHPSRERFLTELTLDPPESTSDESGPPLLDEDYLILSTIHSAKGQEWNAVSVLNVVDGCIPSEMSTGSSAGIEEERRLLYVAMTRAKQHLALLVPQRFYVTQQTKRGDRHMYASLSRFVPPAVAAHFECQQPARGATDGPVPSQAPVLDLGARLRAAWD